MSENNNEYDHVDFRINIMYDAVYNPVKSPYILHPIVKSSISLLDIKMPEDYNYNNVLSEKLDYIGKYNNKISYKRTCDSAHSSTVTFGRYHGFGNVNDLGRSELINPAIHYLLSELVIGEKFKHVLLPVMFFDIVLEDLKKFCPDAHDKFNNDPTLNINVSEKSKINVFVTEHYFQTQTLREYISENYGELTIQHWKVIIFQVLFTLNKITERLQKFRHNMLNLDSIKIYRKKKGGETQYKIGQVSFSVPNLGFEIKMSDFMYSSTSDHVRNKDTRLIQENPYYDIHYFISCLYLFLIKEYGSIPDGLNKFINEMIPARFMPQPDGKFEGLDEREFDTVSSQMVVPANTLKKNAFFSDFRSQQFQTEVEVGSANSTDLTSDLTKSEAVSIIETNPIKISELGNIDSDINYLSPTENSSDLKLLAKKIPTNKKKSAQYYNKDMIKGSRKIIVPGFVNSESESGVFDKAEQYRLKSKKDTKSKDEKKIKSKSSKSNKTNKKASKKPSKEEGFSDTDNTNTSNDSEGMFDKSDVLQAKNDLMKKIDSISTESSIDSNDPKDTKDSKGNKHHNKHLSESSNFTIKLSSSEASMSATEAEREAEKFLRALKEAGKKKGGKDKKSTKKNKKSKKSKSKKYSESSSELSTTDTDSSDNINSNIRNLNNRNMNMSQEHIPELKNIPNNYFGEAPDNLVQKYGANYGLEGFDTTGGYPINSIDPMMNMHQPMQQMLPSHINYPQFQQPMNGMDMMNNPQQIPNIPSFGMGVQNMPQSLYQPSQPSQLPQMPQMNQLGLPMLQPGVMMGGSKNKINNKKFSIMKDGKIVKSISDDFFF